MLENLKRTINEDLYASGLMEAAAEEIGNDNDDIRDIMLDDPDAIVIGAENDPEIAKLVDDLPDVTTEDDPVTASDIEKISEEYIPESATTSTEKTSVDDDNDDDDVKADNDDDDDDDEIVDEASLF